TPLLAPASLSETSEIVTSLDQSTDQEMGGYSPESSLSTPPPVQRVMDPGFLDMSGISFPELTNLTKVSDISATFKMPTADTSGETENLTSNSESTGYFENLTALDPEDLTTYPEGSAKQPELDQPIPSVSSLPSLVLPNEISTTALGTDPNNQETKLLLNSTESSLSTTTLKPDEEKAHAQKEVTQEQ
ncbi:PREDICTED: Golgi reassembly-stacking protein 1-like, partial [Tinamus guttatus]|uniref:Golgi reassembly-stacking protein 1-like n=1 Tax=Tinamus guttatus TaxID=94827 RepID=UPI00052E93D3